jgi:hypothetical protein
LGRPGRSAIAIADAPAIWSACRDWVSCLLAALPRSPSAVERVTMMPLETESSSAGIWVTRPSPMVSRLNRSTASAGAMPIWTTPMMMPPTRLMTVMMMPAMASPLTNFDPPSIAP